MLVRRPRQEHDRLRILIVKTSSMGDVIHTLPAVTDAVKADPSLRFDWVVEEGFREIPGWHPAVERVIPVAVRRWRRQIRRTLADREIGHFREQLQQIHYDRVIDAQGLIKSGIISRMARGITVGLSNSTIKEPLATLFYNKVYSVPREKHAVERLRELFSRALGYRMNGAGPDYGIDGARLVEEAGAGEASEPTLVFLHGTTWPNKHWPLRYWRELARLAVLEGYRVELPWGSEEEYRQACSIAEGQSEVRVLDRQSLSGVAARLGRARGVVAVDTGLGHLAAALGVPAVSLYGPTDPRLAGTYGEHQHWLTPDIECSPCQRRRCLYSGEPVHDEIGGERFAVNPPCFARHGPAAALEQLRRLMAGRAGAS